MTPGLRESIDTRPDMSLDDIFQKRAQEFKRIRIEHPRLLRIRREINQLRAEARGSIGQEQFVLPIIGPSQSGKSLALDHYFETVLRKIPSQRKNPFTASPISNGSTLKQLQGDILGALIMTRRER